jgi:CRISPR-associated protein Csd2
VLGNAPAHKLFDLIKVQRSVDGEQFDIGAKGTDGLPSARSFSDYAVSVNTAALPEGVTVIEKD